LTWPTHWKRTLTVSLGLIAACLLVFGAVLQHSFINFDDNAYIYDNQWVRSGLTWAGFAWAFTTVDLFYWQPLTWLSHMIDCQIFGLQAGWHHLFNLLFHAANSVLVFLVFRRLTGAFWRSAALAGLFALHPLRVESVAWASERNDVLGAFWFLLVLWLYQRHAERPGGRRYLLVLAALLLGLMSKPMLVMVPVLLLLLDGWPLRRKAFAEKLPMVPLALISSFLTYLAVQRLGFVNWGATIPLSHRIANALVSYVSYLELTFWPHDLALPYPYRMVIPWWQTAGAVFLLAALTAAALWYGRQRPYLTMGWLWFAVGLVPAIGLVQAGRQAMADRFTYLPCLGLGLIVVWGAAELLKDRPRLGAFLYAITLLGCATASRRQLAVWQNSVTLFSHALQVTHDNLTAERHLAVALEEQGRFAEALPHYAAAVRIEPSYFFAQNEYALALERRGDTEAAAEHFRAALRYCPWYVEARNNLNRLERQKSALASNSNESAPDR
jgi:tetratricopeptide (TPR) repeat protein